jgi:long-chain fatty acid transport protein
MQNSVRKISQAVSLALIAGTASTVHASGFALIENSASGMGNAFAGAAAIADDASTIWFNPAGMTKLSGNQMVIAAHYISPSAKFSNTNSQPGAVMGTVTDDAGVNKVLVNFYYTSQLDDVWTFGLGINTPFGLATEYNDNWIGRYTATKSDVMTININPALAVKANDKLSLGFGFNWQYIDATLNSQLDAGAICIGMDANFTGLAAACSGAGVNPGDATSSQSLNGDDWSWGLNLGLIYDFTPDTRLGVAYRTGVNHDLEGDVNFTMNATFMGIVNTLPFGYDALFDDSAVTAHVELPDTLSFSLVHNMNSDLTLLGDVTWTGWSRFDELKIQYANPVQSDSVIPENWSNSWRFSLGANYRANESMLYRVGVALDQTPIDTPENRTPRIPDNDRIWLSLGLNYNLGSDKSLDVGYSHLFVDDADINNTDPVHTYVINGSYESSVDILSAQFNMKF